MPFVCFSRTSAKSEGRSETNAKNKSKVNKAYKKQTKNKQNHIRALLLTIGRMRWFPRIAKKATGEQLLIKR